VKLFLQQLVYFDDLLDPSVIPIDGREIASPDEVKAFFERLVAAYLG